MNSYTFKSRVDGDLVQRCRMERFVTVEAPTEERARHLAMVKRWGPPRGNYEAPYKALGLDLIEVMPVVR